MRIVHIQPGAFYDGWTYQENLLTKWQRKNCHDVTVITTRWSVDAQGSIGLVPEDRYDYINEDGVRLIRLPLNGKDRYTLGYDDLYGAIDRLNPEILFIHGLNHNTSAITEYLKLHKNVTAYADNHNDFSNSGRKWSIKFQINRILGRTSRESRALIPYVKKFYGVLPARVDYLQYVYKIPAEKCELLLMGADDDLVAEARAPEVRKSVREKYGIAPDDFLVMTGGKIDIAKAQTLFLMEAVRNIHTINQRIRLIVFGPVVEELRERFNALVDGEIVQYVKYVEGRETYKYFAASDLVVFPGRHSVFWEQVTGLGVPMFCKEWDGTKHVDLGGNVRFLRHNSTAEIQREITRLMDNPGEYQAMKETAEREGMRVFSYSRIARQSIEEEQE
ncbi:MAG: glycosyltransferase family 4 protein [Synergistaceae bacterium]|nr:glycosyltransferase family 4 protein [Synergistaceae bacterium]